MSQNEVVNWVIAYDIAHKRRLAQVHRLMKKQGVPLQYSVFLVHGSSARIASLMGQLGLMIDKRQDDVRAYRVPAAVECHTLGASLLPGDMLIGTDTQLARSVEKFPSAYGLLIA